MGLDPIEFAGLDQGGDDGPVLRPGIVSGEERIFAVEGYGTDGALDWIVVEFDAAIGEEQAQPVPVFGDVFQGFSSRRFA